MTLTLHATAVKLIVFPVASILVVGSTWFGCSGVLLAVSPPRKTWTVPVLATLLNGSMNANGASVPAVFEI